MLFLQQQMLFMLKFEEDWFYLYIVEMFGINELFVRKWVELLCKKLCEEFV